MDRVAGGRLADKRLWVTLLRIAAWVVAGLALVLGIVNFFVAWDFTALLGAASYRTRGANVGLSLLAMVMTWFTGAVATIMMMVFANMADDVNRTRTNAEARTTATDTSGSVTTE
jgi:uncharacterized membrane protein